MSAQAHLTCPPECKITISFQKDLWEGTKGPMGFSCTGSRPRLSERALLEAPKLGLQVRNPGSA
jgi:hypothetical protein